MSDNIDADSAALALFHLELADSDQGLAIQDVLASKTFPQFSQLPYDLRLMVYRCMFPGARRIYIYGNDPNQLRLKVSQSPITSKVNSESRKETLKVYQVMNASDTYRQLSFQYLWNPRKDILQSELYATAFSLATSLFSSGKIQWAALTSSTQTVELTWPESEAPTLDELHWLFICYSELETQCHIPNWVLRNSGSHQIDMEAWRDNFLKAFQIFKDFRAKEGIDISIPVISIWGV
ncbi:hypothetical protein BKA64DRAFT_714566 [Cadophora sp. MPI-SDFR-AT-0126]|nr:hypothetical protein BKA64DRAFT_714566 [Leotiomycetes sp. MPI-SDFR-AT-0126]